MKTAKKVLLFVMGLMIVSMIVIISCKNRYLGPSDKGIFDGVNEENGGGGDEFGGNTLPAGYLTQDEQYEPMDPDSKRQVLFTGDYRIPALTVTAKKTILAAVGTGTASSHIAIKKSSDMGQTWTEVRANYEGFSGMYTHPFFINGYDGSILLGVATTNSGENKTIIYKSTDDGTTWSKSTTIDTNSVNNGNTKVFNGYVTYGQGITLRHGNNANKLLFPYFFGTNAAENGFTATMCSTDGGATFSQLGSPYGKFTSHETKFIELSDGSVLLNIRVPNGQTYWMLSSDCGNTWQVKTSGTTETGNNVNSGKHADFTRYEFNGRDIKRGGEKYALMVLSKKNTNAYNVRMTLNDFGGGAGGFNAKYTYNRDFSTNVGGDGYPAVTVLPDGTIATLTEETEGIVFRRFNLSWLTSSGEEGVGGDEYVDYEIDNITK